MKRTLWDIPYLSGFTSQRLVGLVLLCFFDSFLSPLLGHFVAQLCELLFLLFLRQGLYLQKRG